MKTFSVAIQARMKHGALSEALVRRGQSQKQVAEFLGVSYATLNRWINLRDFPRDLTMELEIRLFELTGKMAEELWPEAVFTEEFLAAPKKAEAIRDVPIHLLPAMRTSMLALPPVAEEGIRKRELADAIEGILHTLTPQQERVLRGRFLDEKTLEQAGADEGLSTSRIEQIEVRALRDLRSPGRAHILRPFR